MSTDLFLPRVIFAGFAITTILILPLHEFYRLEKICPRKELESLTRGLLTIGLILLFISLERTLPALALACADHQDKLSAYSPFLCGVFPEIKRPTRFLSPSRWLLVVTVLTTIGLWNDRNGFEAHPLLTKRANPVAFLSRPEFRNPLLLDHHEPQPR